MLHLRVKKKMDSDYEWEPPSDAEMKLIQARRERSDKISKLMGDYLLKGYKMLGSTCQECSTILLQTRQGTLYCVACSELDSDADKDDPVTNQTAAMAQAREHQLTSVTSSTSSPLRTTVLGLEAVNVSGNATELMSQASFLSRETKATVAGGQRYIVDVIEKLDWAAQELKQTHNVEHSIQLCHLIKSCAEAVSSLKAAFES